MPATADPARRGVWREAFAAGLAPDPRLSVREWADLHRYLSTTVAEAAGRWRTARTPYLADIMEDLSPSSPVDTVVLMGGAQVGKTELGLNLIGYTIDVAPGPVMAVWPSLDLAEHYSKQRIRPLIEDSPRLRDKVRASRSRDSGNTLLTKEFPGGILRLVGANSPVGLRSMPAKTLILDDVDAFPSNAGDEGDPVKLAEARTRTFRRCRKVLKISTPKVRGYSRIEKAYLATDRRRFHVPCPACGLFQPLEWAGVRWDEGKPRTARYACAGCGVLIEEGNKTAMLEAGRWVPQVPDADPATRGYHLSSLYSPLGWYSWADAAKDFEETKVDGVTDPELLRVFVNAVLGESYVQRGDAPDWERIHERREVYPVGRVPARGLFLTAGVDVQGDRIEATIVAWGRNRESWQVEHRVLPGDPEADGGAVWELLDDLLDEEFPHELGTALPIRMLAIDSGHATSHVYTWARGHTIGRVMVCKGRGNFPTTVGQPTAVDVSGRGRKIRRGVRVWPIGVGLLKSELYGFLRLPVPKDGAPAAGYCHFPELPEEFFRQLTAEELVPVTKRGYRKLEWTKLPGRRNEVLDCRVYARAAALVLGADRWPEARWARLEAALGVASPPPPPQSGPTSRPEEPDAPRPRRRGEKGGRFMDRWQGGH